MWYFDPSIEAIKLSEDHPRRSKAVFDLTSTCENTNSIGSTPKTIIQFWNDMDKIPQDVQDCMDSWKTLASSGFH
jgi:hypothetical protein